MGLKLSGTAYTGSAVREQWQRYASDFIPVRHERLFTPRHAGEPPWLALEAGGLVTFAVTLYAVFPDGTWTPGRELFVHKLDLTRLPPGRHTLICAGGYALTCDLERVHAGGKDCLPGVLMTPCGLLLVPEATQVLHSHVRMWEGRARQDQDEEGF